jgi:hypothetical protein
VGAGQEAELVDLDGLGGGGLLGGAEQGGTAAGQG